MRTPLGTRVPIVLVTTALSVGACTPRSDLASDSTSADSTAIPPPPAPTPDTAPAAPADTTKRHPLTEQPVKSDPEPPPDAPVIPRPE